MHTQRGTNGAPRRTPRPGPAADGDALMELCLATTVLEERLRLPPFPAVSGLSPFVKKENFYSLGDSTVQKHKGLKLRKYAKIQPSHSLRALPADLTSLPSRLWESPRDFINSREIYRQPSSWGCWEPGRPPESFPLSRPSSPPFFFSPLTFASSALPTST